MGAAVAHFVATRWFGMKSGARRGVSNREQKGSLLEDWSEDESTHPRTQKTSPRPWNTTRD
jgi:hypothetical protein